MTKITSKIWRFWFELGKRWPFVRGWSWIQDRRRDAFYKWRDKK